MKCDGKIISPEIDVKTGRYEDMDCQNLASTMRENFRFGDTTKGEPAIVPMQLQLCSVCAERYDETQAEAEAEGLAS